jgi:hypothetical protein
MRWLAGICLSIPVGAWLLSATPARADEDTARFMPADTDLVLYVNVRQLLQSAVVKDYALEPVKSALKDNDEARKALDALGIDPLRDIHTLQLAGQANTAPKVLLVVRGEFDVDKLHKAATEYIKNNPAKGKLHEEGKLKVYEITEQDVTGFALVVDKRTVLIGRTKDYVLEAARQTEVKIKPDLKALLKEQDPKQSLWFVGVATEEIRSQLGGDPRTAALAGKINAVSGRLLVTESIVADFRIHAADARSATALARFVGEMKAFAVFAARDIDKYGPVMARALDSFKVSSDKSVVLLSATISKELISDVLPKK